MNRYFLTATTVILIFSCGDDVLRYMHLIEDSILPLDPLDLSFLEDLQEVKDGFLLKGTNPAYSNCSGWRPPKKETIAKGWSKSVYSFTANTVIKSPNIEGKTFQNCFHANFGEKDWEMRCRVGLLRGFLSEIKILLELQDSPQVIKLISYCIPREPLRNLENVNIVTEKGTPLDILSLIQLPLQRRNSFFNALLSFFTENPKLRLHDFRRQQLVVVGDQPKIVDFDEAYFIEEELEVDLCAFGILSIHPQLLHYAVTRRKLISELLVNHTGVRLQH